MPLANNCYCDQLKLYATACYLALCSSGSHRWYYYSCYASLFVCVRVFVYMRMYVHGLAFLSPAQIIICEW